MQPVSRTIRSRNCFARSPSAAAAPRSTAARSLYVRSLQAAGAPRGVLGFTALPVVLARATLDRIERSGPGSAIRRADVAALFERLQVDLDAGAPLLV